MYSYVLYIARTKAFGFWSVRKNRKYPINAEYAHLKKSLR